LNHNLFSVGQFYDADLEVAFRKSTCFICDLKGNDLLTEGILHQTSVARTPEQNGVVERRNRTLVEAARTMLSAAKKPSVKFFHIFGSICYIVRDGENLDKMKEKCDKCIFVGYSTQSRAYRVFNKRTRVIMESIHVNFDELPHMASDQLSSDPASECQTMALEHDSLSPIILRQANVPQADRTVTTLNELDLLFSSMFDELLNGSSKVLSKSSAVSAVDAPYQRQNHTTPLNYHTTPAPTSQVPTLAPTVISSENINQAKTYAENDQVADDEFINIFSTPVQDQEETSSHHVDSSISNKSTASSNGFKFTLRVGNGILGKCCHRRQDTVSTDEHLRRTGMIIIGIYWGSNHIQGILICWVEGIVKSVQLVQFSKAVMGTQMKEIFIPFPGLMKRFIEFLLEIRDFITKLTDYGFHFDKIPMYCDSKAAIAISCNPVQHSRTKHIDVRYHFIKEKVEKGIVELFFVETEYQLANLFTKPLPVERFKYLVRQLGMRCLTPAELEALANESA
nr:retrotransposon protein, putative, unclassified [Tanacetum cinerariifolium]